MDLRVLPVLLEDKEAIQASNAVCTSLKYIGLVDEITAMSVLGSIKNMLLIIVAIKVFFIIFIQMSFCLVI